MHPRHIVKTGVNGCINGHELSGDSPPLTCLRIGKPLIQVSIDVESSSLNPRHVIYATAHLTLIALLSILRTKNQAMPMLTGNSAPVGCCGVSRMREGTVPGSIYFLSGCEQSWWRGRGVPVPAVLQVAAATNFSAFLGRPPRLPFSRAADAFASVDALPPTLPI